MSLRHPALAAAVALGLLIGAVPADALPVPHPSPLFRIHDPRIDEASGVAVGHRSAGVVYVHNDSGDSARFFALNARTGGTVATIDVTGAHAVDWEDIASGPDAAGTPSIWLADIGDNDAVRRSVTVYRVDEPRLALGGPGRTVHVPVAQTWHLRYASGPANAESFAVTPDGTGYIVTKSLLGASAVYRLPTSPARGVQTLHPTGRITFRTHRVPNPFGAVGELTATGADISPDGRLLAVRTYAEVYLWRIPHGDVAAALRTRPVVRALPYERQGEGIAFDGHRLIVDSEGRDSPVYSISVPAIPLRPPVEAPSASGSSPAASGADGGSGSWVPALVAGAVLLGGAAVGIGLTRRGRRR